eukprot:jgi/Bigna1/83654/fgenesh1_pg.112_\
MSISLHLSMPIPFLLLLLLLPRLPCPASDSHSIHNGRWNVGLDQEKANFSQNDGAFVATPPVPHLLLTFHADHIHTYVYSHICRKEVQANIARVKFEGASKNFNESVIATADAVVHTNSTISSYNEHGWDDGIDDSPALHLNPEDSQQEQVVLMRVRRLAKKLDINEEDAIMFQRAQMRLAKQMQRFQCSLYLLEAFISLTTTRSALRICFDSWLSSPHAADERHSMNIGNGKELKSKKEISREEKETYNGEVGARSSRRDLSSDTTTTAALGDSAILSTTSLIELRDVLCDIDTKVISD